jgi:DNA invertase Pin-like site-specific DNA recombinase
MSAQGRFVAYYRVSAGKQGKSGPGPDAQRNVVLHCLNGDDWLLVGEFTEIESGKRPELEKALAVCKRQNGKLVIAKLDRLSRNVAFIVALNDFGVEFIAVDNRHANKFTVHILTAVAQDEREMIARRTKDALQAAKVRGVVLGNPRLDAVRDRAVASVKADAGRFAKNVAPIIGGIQSKSVTSRCGIARSLNSRSIRTARGGEWTAVQVGSVVLRRVGEL